MKKRLLKILILILVVGGLAFWGYTAVKNRDLNINRFFVGGQIMGVDVSLYQEDVDFNELSRQDVKFVYIKATEGATHVDSSFSKKWEDALNSGVESGAYHYFVYGVSGVEQAKNFINTVGKLDGRLIPAVDMELSVEEVYDPPEVDDVVRSLKAFLVVVEEEYGVKPIIYAQKDYWDKYLAKDFGDYPRWVRNVFYPV